MTDIHNYHNLYRRSNVTALTPFPIQPTSRLVWFWNQDWFWVLRCVDRQQRDLTEQVDASRENEPPPPFRTGALDCSILMPLLLWGAGWVEDWGKPVPYAHITHISKKKSTPLTWSPPNRSFLAAAESDFAEDPQEMPLAERAGVFAWAGATF